ncbi:MAG: anti-sigma factor family protein [Rhodoferax sp.]
MSTPPPSPANADTLHPLVDGQSDPLIPPGSAPRAALDAQALATVQAWQQQRQAIRQLHHGVLDEPIPASMAARVQGLRPSQGAANAGRWATVATAALASFVLGWWGHGHWGTLDAPTLARSNEASGFVRQARYAHAAYTPEVRHPVDVQAAEEQHLVQWLSKRLGRPLRVPHLEAQGYALVGGRLLPGEQAMRAQFMYQHESGQRLTLYLGALPAQAPQAQDTGFRFQQEQGLSQFYWVDQGWGYALSADLERTALLRLADAAYQQLQP